MKKTLNITRALADENRLRALMMLRNGEMCVCRIIEMLGLAPSTVSKHMSILKQADLVETRRAGKWTYYRLPGEEASPEISAIIGWVNHCLSDDALISEDKKKLTGARSCQS